jgi:potassium/hydrogen antiporter
VILLLLSGMGAQLLTKRLHVEVPFVEQLLPSIGTLGLLLIVLEGSLDLELSPEKKRLIGRTLLIAALGVTCTGAGVAALVHFSFGLPWLMSWTTAIPFAVISSAVAIPSAKILGRHSREFITYESSFSDILGVLAFSYVTSTTGVDLTGIILFGANFVLTCLLALIVSLALIWYLDKVDHHVRFLPVFGAMVLAYSVAKLYHLSPLILIFLFGLALSNTRVYLRGRMMRYFHATRMESDLRHFRSIGSEAVFLVKSIFFILFGFSIELNALLEMENFLTGMIISLIIIAVRFALVVLILKERWEILFFGPRGLISVLLFIGVPALYSTPHINSGVVTWVVLLTILFMLPGSLKRQKKEELLSIHS